MLLTGIAIKGNWTQYGDLTIETCPFSLYGMLDSYRFHLLIHVFVGLVVFGFGPVWLQYGTVTLTLSEGATGKACRE